MRGQRGFADNKHILLDTVPYLNILVLIDSKRKTALKFFTKDRNIKIWWWLQVYNEGLSYSNNNFTIYT